MKRTCIAKYKNRFKEVISNVGSLLIKRKHVTNNESSLCYAFFTADSFNVHVHVCIKDKGHTNS